MIHAFNDDKSKVNLGNAADLPYSGETLIDNIKKVNKKTEYTTLAIGNDNITVNRSTLLQYNELQVICIADDYGFHSIGTQTVPIDRFLEIFNNQSAQAMIYIGNGAFFSNVKVTYANNIFTFIKDNAVVQDHSVTPTYYINAR